MNFTTLAKGYLKQFQKIYVDSMSEGRTSVELASRPCVHDFLEKLWISLGAKEHNLVTLHEPQLEGTKGTPDWKLSDSISHGVYFYGEHKNTRLSAPYPMSQHVTNQISRYLELGRPIFLFDGIEFLFFRQGCTDQIERVELINKPVNPDTDWARETPNLLVQSKFLELLESPGFTTWNENKLIGHIAVRARHLADILFELISTYQDGGSTIQEEELLVSIHKLQEVVSVHHDPILPIIEHAQSS